MNQLEGIRQIVERARSGDQVAMALIDQTRQQADKGNKKAQRSRKLIQQYISRHPASTMAGDDSSASTNPAAQLALWKAQKGSQKEFATVVAKAAPHVGTWALICAIFHGPKLAKGCPLMVVAATPKSKIAQCVRKAFSLQRVAYDPKVPIGSYCRMTAAELGE